jgi:hypothetical protein
MSWITNSDGARLFRPGAAPPLRGTLLTLSDHELILYTTGSIEFYSTYPGMHIPQPIGIRSVTASLSHREIAGEIMALTKMNWEPDPARRPAARHPTDSQPGQEHPAVLRARPGSRQPLRPLHVAAVWNIPGLVAICLSWRRSSASLTTPSGTNGCT